MNLVEVAAIVLVMTAFVGLPIAYMRDKREDDAQRQADRVYRLNTRYAREKGLM